MKFVATCVLRGAAVWALFTAAMAQAALVNWGDVSDPAGNVIFRQVTENNSLSSTVFAPQATGPTATGDSLMFSPVNFQSQSSSNSAAAIDSTIRTTIEARPGQSINSISVFEFGDYSLGGLVGGQANASVGAAFFWRVVELSGLPVSLPLQTATLNVTGGGFYARPSGDGTARPWTGSVLLDVASYLASLDTSRVATKIELTFDNTLQTAADQVSTSFIKKKEVEITVDNGTPEIPEPAAAGLLALALGSMAAMRYRLG